jgi:hypothetical protein
MKFVDEQVNNEVSLCEIDEVRFWHMPEGEAIFKLAAKNRNHVYIHLCMVFLPSRRSRRRH